MSDKNALLAKLYQTLLDVAASREDILFTFVHENDKEEVEVSIYQDNSVSTSMFSHHSLKTLYVTTVDLDKNRISSRVNADIEKVINEINATLDKVF